MSTERAAPDALDRFLGPDNTRSGRSKIPDRGPLGEELGVREHLEPKALVVRVEDSRHRRRGPDGQRRLLDDDLAPVRVRDDLARGLLPVHARSAARPAPSPKVLVGCVDRHEDEISQSNTRRHVRGEEEVPAACPADDGVETRLVNGKGSLFQALMRSRFVSVTVISICGHLSAMTAIVGPPT